jgi:hypothetical protein
MKKAGPDTVSSAYSHMAPLWDKISSVLGGTETMRASGTMYLPQHDRESNAAYDERLNRTILINTTEQTLNGWVGRPFSKPMQVNANIPDELAMLLEDVDRQGNDLDVFCRNWFRDGLAKGFSHVLVDFPALQGDGPRTLADDRAAGLRPYFVHLPPENVIAAHAEMVNGVETLTHVRVHEQEVVRDGFEEMVVDRIRVYEPGLVEVYEKRGTKGREEWVVVESYNYDLPYIPIVTFYAQRDGFMVSKPPLLDLVNMNIAHWQSQSDQTAVLTVARFPMLASSGMMDDDEVVVGPNQWLATRDPQGRVYYVEHSGKAINSGRMDLLDLEEKMAKYGAEFLTKKPGRQTATARALDSAEAISPLQDMTHRFVDSVNLAMQYASDWLGIESGGTVDLHTDFGLSSSDAGALTALTEARRSRDISRETYLRELQRYNVLDRSFDIDVDGESLRDEQSYAGLSTQILVEEDDDEGV